MGRRAVVIADTRDQAWRDRQFPATGEDDGASNGLIDEACKTNQPWAAHYYVVKGAAGQNKQKWIQGLVDLSSMCEPGFQRARGIVFNLTW